VYDIMVMGNGALAGLVAITSGCSTVQPWAAVIIGIVAGSLYCIGSKVSILAKVSNAPLAPRPMHVPRLQSPDCSTLRVSSLAPTCMQDTSLASWRI
jgi:tetrahydromethanopterin S-methyltransferase subunit C